MNASSMTDMAGGRVGLATRWRKLTLDWLQARRELARFSERPGADEELLLLAAHRMQELERTRGALARSFGDQES
jgi:hypothetical protein